MKKSKPLSMITHLAGVGLLATLVGCASSNSYEKGAKTGAGLTESANVVADGKGKIETTMTALNDLVGSPQGDLAPKYQKFSAAVKDLDATAKHVSSRFTQMQSNSKEYFAAWDAQVAQIKNEDIKNRTLERKTEVQNKLMEIKRNYAEAQMAFKPFMSDLKDIQTVLGTDLTTAGLAAVKPAVDKTNKDADPVKAQIDKLAASFKDLGVALSTSTPAAGTNAPPTGTTPPPSAGTK